jgi:hypothetical protein
MAAHSPQLPFLSIVSKKSMYFINHIVFIELCTLFDTFSG